MIHLTDDICLEADDNCFTLVEWSGSVKKHKGVTVPAISRRRYCSTLDGVMQGLAKMLTLRVVQASTPFTN